MKATEALRRLLSHIDRTSIQSDPEQLLVAVSREQVERAWAVVHAEMGVSHGNKSGDKNADVQAD